MVAVQNLKGEIIQLILSRKEGGGACTVKPVLRDHSGENAKVVSYSRWSFNTGSTIQLKNNVVIDYCYSTTS